MNTRFTKTLRGYLNRRTPGYLIFFVTPYCDCRCRMCFNRKVIDAAASRDTLTFEEIEKITMHFPGLHHVNFSGGEPFLRPDFSRIPHLFYQHSGTRVFACPTNSSQPEKIAGAVQEICNTCPDAWIRITQSMDGIGKDHDAIRGKPGLFECVVELNHRLARLRESCPNLSVGVSMVMSSLNQGKEEDILKYAYEHLDFSDFGVLYARGDTYDADAARISNAAYERFMRLCREYAAAQKTEARWTGRLFSAINRTASDLLVRSIMDDRYVTPCHAARHMVVMDDEGTISPCEILEYYIATGKASLDTAVLGNIRDYDYDIVKLMDAPHVKEIQRYIIDSKCYCSFECAMSVNVLYSPGLWPRVVKNLFR